MTVVPCHDDVTSALPCNDDVIPTLPDYGMVVQEQVYCDASGPLPLAGKTQALASSALQSTEVLFTP